jgi:hypothetical protein
MSTIYRVIDELEKLLNDQDRTQGSVDTSIKDVLKLLKDRTVLLLEWNELDIQQMARVKIAQNNDYAVDDIIESPLTREQVVDVIGILDNYYDCNYGITWNSIDNALDDIDLPDVKACLKPKMPMYDSESETIKKVKSGLYLGLSHGFHSAEERAKAQDWGARGALIGPLSFVHTTYGAHVRVEFESPEDARIYGLEDGTLDIDKEGCLVFGDMQYGDWTVMFINNDKEVKE